MNQYLLSTHSGDSGVPGAPSTPEEWQVFMERVQALETEMDASGTLVFGGALRGPESARVVRPSHGDIIMTDGPFVEAKEHIAGFYIINAADLDEALAWARKTAVATNHPIEVRPFAATGRMKA